MWTASPRFLKEYNTYLHGINCYKQVMDDLKPMKRFRFICKYYAMGYKGLLICGLCYIESNNRNDLLWVLGRVSFFCFISHYYPNNPVLKIKTNKKPDWLWFQCRAHVFSTQHSSRGQPGLAGYLSGRILCTQASIRSTAEKKSRGGVGCILSVS